MLHRIIACFGLCFLFLASYAATPCTTLWVDNQTEKTLHLSGHVNLDLPPHLVTAVRDAQCHNSDHDTVGTISFTDEAGRMIRTGDELFFNPFVGDDETNHAAVSADAFARSWQVKNNLLNRVYYYGPHTWFNTTLFGVADPVNNGHYRDFEKYACPKNEVCPNNPYLSTGSLQGDHFSEKFHYEWRMVYSRTHNPKDQFFWTPEDPNDIFSEPLPSQAKNGDFVLKITALAKNKTVFDRIYIFGDSISDRNNLYSITAGNMPRGVFYNGRFTTYLNWVDQFQLHTGAPIVDYAFGGSAISKALSTNANFELSGFAVAGSEGLPHLPSLVDEFNAAEPQILRDIAVGKRIAIIVFMGNNDFSHHLGTGEEVAHRMQIDILHFKQEINELLGPPATPVTFFLSALGDLGLAPVYNRAPEATKFAADFSKVINSTDYQATELPGFKTWAMPIDGNILQLEKNLGQFGFDPDAWENPVKHHMFGSFYGNTLNGANLLGYKSLDQYPGDGTTIHSSFSLLDVDLSQINTAVCAGLLHPGSKLQVILASNLIQFLYSLEYLDIPDDTTDPYLRALLDNAGMIYLDDENAFDYLLKYAEKSHYKRPDFASNFDNGPTGE